MIMTCKIDFSVIIPVYNRPDEMEELLASLANQTDKDFEVVVVEDGSTIPCKEVCEKYNNTLNINYLLKHNSGRSETRNYGMERATGNYFVIYDSDCIIPSNYFEIVRKELTESFVDCYGGPDSADNSFSEMQKAINYSMTSFMTTGGIRGGTKKTGKFTPRSFNMGISKETFEKVGGYKNMIGEDIDLSIRIKTAGFQTRLLRDAVVFHKRRVDIKKFYKQVNTFGKGRVLLHRIHKGSLKPVFLLPVCFIIGNILLVLLSIIFLNLLFLLPIGIYILAIFIESSFRNNSISVGIKSILTSFAQLFGYGLGFLSEMITKKASKALQEELYK